MRAVEFQAMLNADRILAVPALAVDSIPIGIPVRVLILFREDDEDRGWERRAAEEFGRGYAGTDAIYDRP